MKIVTEVYAFSSEKLDQRNTAYEIRLTGYFCSDTIFSLSKKVLLDAKGQVMLQSKIRSTNVNQGRILKYFVDK